MQKTIFEITKMDCPSEENLIRMKLDGISSITNLDFNIPNRILTVFHNGEIDQIEKSVYELNLGGKKSQQKKPSKSILKNIQTKGNYFGQSSELTLLSLLLKRQRA